MELKHAPLSIAVPWSLSSCIPANGFHPLYKALFDFDNKNIKLNAWDCVSLYCFFRDNENIRKLFLNDLLSSSIVSGENKYNKIKEELSKNISDSDRVLLNWLPGDIEFFHTYLFPTFTRPFIFHCESFAPIFFPFAHQGVGDYVHNSELIEYYKNIFESPLCLGIFSHIPETLDSFKKLFNSEKINSKLFPSMIGLKSDFTKGNMNYNYSDNEGLRFLFVNSAHQNMNNFFKRGGHIVLLFWEKFIEYGGNGTLVIRCRKPSDQLLNKYGVDIEFVSKNIGKNIIWSEDYLPTNEMDQLMLSSDFFLLPSASLHSASILSAISMGTIPVVTDTVGPQHYVTDDISAIVLKGVYQAIWKADKDCGVLMDDYSQFNASLSEDLSNQLFERINSLCNHQEKIKQLKKNGIKLSHEKFSYSNFSKNFWDKVIELYDKYLKTDFHHGFASQIENKISKSNNFLMSEEKIYKAFDSVPQPVQRLILPGGQIYDMGGYVIYVPGRPIMLIKDWSPIEQFINSVSNPIYFSHNYLEFFNHILIKQKVVNLQLKPMFIHYVSLTLRHIPFMYRIARSIYRNQKSIRNKFKLYVLCQKARIKKCSLDKFVYVMADNVNGYQIIKCFHLYYAVKNGSDVFDVKDFFYNKRYQHYFSYTVNGLMTKLKLINS